jgi:hypothetical protein
MRFMDVNPQEEADWNVPPYSPARPTTSKEYPPNEAGIVGINRPKIK